MGERCACPLTDARECFRFRHGIGMRELFDQDLEDEVEPCCCSCHVPEELDELDVDSTCALCHGSLEVGWERREGDFVCSPCVQRERDARTKR